MDSLSPCATRVERRRTPGQPVRIARRQTLRRRTALVAATLMLACAPRAAAAADCELALVYAAMVVDNGQRAMASQNYVAASNLASNARLPAIDAAQQAKACRCPEAMPFLAEAALEAARVNMAANLTAAQQFAAVIRKQGQAAVDALRRCATR
jgi:hypothetical protein